MEPGAYQVRAHIPGGRAWFEAGRILYANPDPTDAERTVLANLNLRLAPFKKGRWKKYSVLDGLPVEKTGRILFAPNAMLWLATINGLSRFDSREFFNITPENGLPVRTAPLDTHRDTNGVFWLGTVDGLWLDNPEDDKPPVRFTTPNLRTDGILEITGTADGAIWWRTQEALVRFHGGHGTEFTNLWRYDNPSWLKSFPQRLAVVGDRL
ncbi:MAG: hypothetical protein EXS36_16910 [Pedosphaera sp.]|nr:hypothetical protein [Pedosphaera sp.]